jgi:signal peptidase I
LNTAAQTDGTAAAKKKSFWHKWRRDIVMLGVVVGATFTAKSSLADHYYVPSGSMLPTVHVDDRVLVNKLAYGLRVPIVDNYLVTFGGPARGDVVVLNSPEDGKVLLKRVVAVAGDEVHVAGGQLELNGRAVPVAPAGDGFVEELGAAPHPLDLDAGGGPTFGPVRVPEGQFLVLGDNRGNSHDGRMFGFVRMKDILGKASVVFMRDGHLTWIGL